METEVKAEVTGTEPALPEVQPAPAKPAVPNTVDATGKTAEEPRYTQADIDRIVKDRLAQAERKSRDAAERAAQLAREESAKKSGEWQTLAEAYEPKAKRTDELEKFIRDLLDAETSGVPDTLRKLIPTGDPLTTLRWVRDAKAAGVLAAPSAPRTDAGESNQPGRKPGMSDAQRRELAAIYGVKPEYLP